MIEFERPVTVFIADDHAIVTGTAVYRNQPILVVGKAGGALKGGVRRSSGQRPNSLISGESARPLPV